ncbi:uncharacterized protein LOC121369221 [Gigantopelta aegis]|uniref:uncharacterized protein LOC121369221 n=1 Tax=Gigantopelta aegis TaxID=1735272 RepID=UPI001B88DD6C|nr:uncharacterized protein LOC121369221 [Gigantopelta aegis]XP_041350098.1 uncharacterized protein LOC121369221 [Gigantopelta aegis]XP_041350099.1 uncharacterized protein LOC121369221 [Gigantopelta aegis]
MFEGIDLEDEEEEVPPPKRKEGFEFRKPVRPYICSTPLDFIKERNFLADHIYPSIVEFAQGRGALFSPTDIRWSPEDKVFSNGQLLRFLLDAIDRCSPFFICLLGDCYGPHRPEDEPLLSYTRMINMDKCNPLDRNYLMAATACYGWLLHDDNQACSLTELEIIHAAFLGDSTHCRFYFRQRDHLEDKYMRAGGRESEMQRLDSVYLPKSEYAGLKIQDLRQRIVKKGLPVQYFTTLEELGNLVLNDWIDIVDQLYPTPVKPFQFQETEKYREWLVQESFAESRRQVYVSSPDNNVVMSRMTRFAMKAVDDATQEMSEPVFSKYRTSTSFLSTGSRLGSLVKYKSVLCLSGERGAGKSSIIAQWLDEFDDTSLPLQLVHHFVGCSSHSTDITVFLERCITELRSRFLKTANEEEQEEIADGTHAYCGDDYEPKTFQELCGMFMSAVSLGPCVLVIDGVDELCGTVKLSQETVKEFGWLPAVLPPRCKIILSTTNSDITYRSLARRPDVTFIAVPIISSVERQKEILEEHMGQHFARLTVKNFVQLQEIRVCTKPLFLTTLAAELKCYSIYYNIDAFLEEHQELSSVREFWMKSLRRWIKKYSWLPEVDSSLHCDVHDNEFEGFSGWIPDALCLILLSRNGLTEKEVLTLLRSLGYTGSLEVSQFDWFQFRIGIGSALYEKADGLICFSHHHIKEIVQFILLKCFKNGPEGSVVSQESDIPFQMYKRKLHENLAWFFARLPHSQRKVEELPWQLMMSGNCFNLLRVVENIDYFLDFVSKSGNNPSNKRDLLVYWKFLEARGYKANQHYLSLFMDMGLIETNLHVKSPSVLSSLTVIEEKPIEDDEESAVDCHECFTEFRRKKICGSPYQSFEHGLQGMTDSQFFIAESQKHSLLITGDGKVLNVKNGIKKVVILAWHASQLLLELGYSESTEKILSALITFLNKNYPLSLDHLVMRAKTLEVIGDINLAGVKMGKAETSYREALKIIVDVMDADDELTSQPEFRKLRSRMLCHHGSILLEQDELYDAQELLKEALEYTDDSLKNIPLTATVLYNLGLLRLKQGDYHRAESNLRQSLTLRETWFGKTHPLVADVLNHLAKLLSLHEYKGRDRIQAEHLYRRAIQIREECLGNQHLLTAEVLFALGQLIGNQTSLTAKNDSIDLLRQALDITTSHLGLTNTDTKRIQQELTTQEVMLRLGNYEFGHAKPLDTRNRRNPFSTLTLRDKDLKRIQQKYGIDKPVQESLTIRAVSREEILRHTRPMSYMSSTNSYLSASEKLFSEGDRLLHRNSIERKLKHSSSGESPTSPVPRSRLTVDMNFVADSTTGDSSDLHKELIIDSFALGGDMEGPDKQIQPKKSLVRSRISSMSGRNDPFKMFMRFASASSDRSRGSKRLSSSGKGRSKSSVSSITPGSTDGSSSRGHQSRCAVPGRQSLQLSNQQAVVGPHSALNCLMDYPFPDSSRKIHHQSAWYHVPGRYPTSEASYPPKRCQTRPSSVVSGYSHKCKTRSMSSQSSRKRPEGSRGDSNNNVSLSVPSGREGEQSEYKLGRGFEQSYQSEQDSEQKVAQLMENKQCMQNGISSTMVTFQETISVG